MNGVEAAASLFGPDDSSSDPFASLGADDATSVGGEAFRDYGMPQSEPHDLFSTSSDGFDKVQTSSLQENVHDHYTMQPNSSQNFPSYGSSGSLGQQTQNWHSTEGHDSVGVLQNRIGDADNYWPTSTSSESAKAPQPQNTYDPHTPPTNGTHMNTYMPPASGPDYSPYKTPASTVSTVKPSVAQLSSYTSISSGSHNAPPPSYKPPSTGNVRAPTVPAAGITRPKISNAYDPPFPPAVKSKRALSRSGLHQSTTAGYGLNQASNTYGPQDTAFAHQQPVSSSIPAPEPPFRSIPRQEYGDHSYDASYLSGSREHQSFLTHGRIPTDGHQEPFGLSSGNSLPSEINGYHPRGNLEPGSAVEFTNNAQSGKNWHSANASPLPVTDSNISQMDGFSPHVPDFGIIARRPSPDVLLNHVSSVSPALHAQSLEHSPEANEKELLNIASTHKYTNGAQSPKFSRPTAPSSQIYGPRSPEPYGSPKTTRHSVDERRASSPGSRSIRSLNGQQFAKPQPVGRPPSRVENARGLPVANGSTPGPSYSEGAYAPQRTQVPEVGTTHRVPLISSPKYPTYEPPAASLHEVLVKPQSQYAPSPSLLGSNDPLGRTSTRAPVISFGFGGKIIACFHGSTTLNTGFDVALSSRRATNVQIYQLLKVIPRSAIDISASSFPGPLFSDPEANSSSIVRTGTVGQKNKKAMVIKYLVERAEEISHGLGYLNSGSTERRQAEGKLILVKLLRVMVENDGRLSGSPSVDASIRTALLPRLDGVLALSTPEFTTMADSLALRSEVIPMAEPDTVVAVNTLRSSSLDKIQEFLLRGERRQAYCYALDEKLWPHAMIIASSIDKEAWKEVVNEFLKAELGAKDEGNQGHAYPKNKGASLANGREALRAAYSLFSGQGSIAIQELVPHSLLGRGMAKLPVQNALPPTLLTPRTPGFRPPAPSANIPLETLAKWGEIVAMIISSTITLDTSSALTALGDQLFANQYVEAAHACYLLAPQTSLMGGLGNPAVRIVLIGSKIPAVVPNFAADPDPIIFSEVVEFAMSLSAPAKGQEPFSGLPHLQAYRFIRAMSLAEVGEMQLANRYCEAITAPLGRPSPYFTPVLVEQLKGLIDRISGTSHVDKTSSWMGSKISKPSLDSIGGWLEGRIAKFVTGDVDSPTQTQDTRRMEERTFSGPFSTISSATPSARSSPQPTSMDVTAIPPPRSGSAMAFSSQTTHVPVDRASSALDYYKPHVTSAPRVASASAAVASFSHLPIPLSDPNGQPQIDSATEPSTPKVTNDEINQNHEPAWWGGSNSFDYSDNFTKTPTAASFVRVEDYAVKTTSEGFISLMDAPTFSSTLSNTASETLSRPPLPEGEDLEDLGFGNNKEKKISRNDSATEPVQSAEPERKPEPQNTAAASGSSWFSRWWKREQASRPVKASLGDESSFYYDAELKRWVNKKTGSEETASKAAPPPPSRAQTASPGMSGPRSTTVKPTATEAHSASAIDLTNSPPGKSMLRPRSNLGPPGRDSVPSPPTGTRPSPGGPPPSRPNSQTSTRRNLRSRYVDVFQSEGGGS
ncbi:hypothetical protein APHAL10511_001160 [Amanita phalloides]|nr:hypothetical protein APHAL10511_001160 [Amanita phalloides]